MDRHRGYFESDRLTREAYRETEAPVMVMCPTCNRSIPENMPCMVCNPPQAARMDTSSHDDCDKPKLW